VAGRLSHYSALYEVQHDQGMPLDAVQHLHHMVHGESCAGAANTAAAGVSQQLHACFPGHPSSLT
jgi:hypothetical protein